MTTDYKDYSLTASLSLLPGVSPLLLQGYIGTLTTSLRTVWDENTAYTFLAANFSSPTISSASASDTAAGTGARTVAISGLDVTGAIQSETLTLNGQTGVSLVKSYVVINSMKVVTAGSGNKNAGIIYVGTGSITTGKPAVVHGEIGTTNLNQGTSFIYGVPANYTLLIRKLFVNSNSTTAGAHALQLQTQAIATTIVYVAYQQVFLNTAEGVKEDFNPAIVVAGGTTGQLIQLQVLASAGTGPCAATAECYLINTATSLGFNALNNF